MDMTERTDEFAEMLAQFAREVRQMAYAAESVTIFHDMASGEKAECFIAGVLVGLMTALAENIKSKRVMDNFESYVARCVPVARGVADQWIEVSQQGVDTQH